jgi:hypothetical protein
MTNTTHLQKHAEPLAVVSTSHLDMQTLVDFGYLQPGSDMFHGHVIYPNDYGAFFQTEVCSGGRKGVDEEAEMPESLRAVLNWARTHRFMWIKFDSSGPVVDELPTYNHN